MKAVGIEIKNEIYFKEELDIDKASEILNKIEDFVRDFIKTNYGLTTIDNSKIIERESLLKYCKVNYLPCSECQPCCNSMRLISKEKAENYRSQLNKMEK